MVRLRELVAIGAAALAGYAMARSFTVGLWYLAIGALAYLVWAGRHSSKRIRFIRVGTFSFTWFATLLHWSTVLGSGAWVMLTVISALPLLLIAVKRFPESGLSSYLVPTVGLTLVELLRTNAPWGGFPWGLIAYSQVESPLMPLSRIGGDPLLAAAIVIVAVFLLNSVQSHRWVRGAGGVAFVVISTSALGHLLSVPQSTDSARVAVIQGSVPQRGYHENKQAAEVFLNHIAVTNTLASDLLRAGTSVDLVVWPENAANRDPVQNPIERKPIQTAVDALKTPTLIGATTQVSDGVHTYNQAILWQPLSGPGATYNKQQLVPFGEYMPVTGPLTKVVTSLGLVVNNYVAGHEPGLFVLPQFRFGDIICFEVAYDRHFTELIGAGAQFLTVQSNDATYALTEESPQQFAITRLRAYEHNRAIAIATTTGISGFINNDGEVVLRTPEMNSMYAIGEVPLQSEVTFHDRHSHWFEWFIAIILFVFSWRFVRTKLQSMHTDNDLVG